MINCDPILYGRVIGVFAADRLPLSTPSYPHGYIANTDVSSKPGQHWCAFYDDGKGHIDFFDSYGQPPAKNSVWFTRWLHRRAKTLKINDVQLQSDSSSICGLYCILFLHQRLLGYTLEEIVSVFDDVNLASNDLYVYDLMSNAYSNCVHNEHAYNQSCTSILKCI